MLIFRNGYLYQLKIPESSGIWEFYSDHVGLGIRLFPPIELSRVQSAQLTPHALFLNLPALAKKPLGVATQYCRVVDSPARYDLKESMLDTNVSQDSIQAASKRIAARAHRTPIMTNRHLDQLSGNRLYFKSEHLQKSGSFKFRGAQNAVTQLSSNELTNGVITQSSGNHGQALALTANLLNIPAQIIMPHNAPKPKIAAVRDYGATITFCEPVVSERERVLAEVQQQTNTTYVPPYDHPSVISGQGTIGLELLADIAELQAVITPVGGGGLLSGVATAIKSQRPDIAVIGAEPAGADDAAQSIAQGERILQTNPQTIADGLLTSLGRHTFPLIQEFVDQIITVSEEQIVGAMRLMWERTKQLIEPSAAVAVAAALSPQFTKQYSQVHLAVVISGGNVDLDRLPFGKI